MKKMRVAVAGLRFGRTHVEAFRAVPQEAELAAVCSIDETDRAYADSLGVPFYTDYREMIAQEALDGLCVAVPPAFHAELAIYAMEQGVNVLVEKPIAASLEDAERIALTSEKTGKKALVGFHRRLDPSVAALREVIASGNAGRPVGFVLHAARIKGEPYFQPEYRRRRETGGGVLSINGAHDLDLIRYLCGEVKAVSAMKGNAIRGYEVEDTAAVSILCENGAVGTLFLSDCAHPIAELTHTLYLERQTYAFNCSSFTTPMEHTLASCSFDGEERNMHEHSSAHSNAHQAMTAHFLRTLRGEDEPLVSARDAMRSLQLMLATQESLDTGKAVCL